MKQKIKPFVITLMVLAILIVLTSAGLALAEVGGYALHWYSMDGGGATSSGDSYVVNGSTGQPDAWVWSGQDYTVNGGFWPGTQNLNPEPPGRVFIPLIVKD